jgi:hypothetical protein
MNPTRLSCAAGAAAVIFANTAFLARPAATSSVAQAPAENVVVTGCIHGEEEYRRAIDAGRGGAAGTGVGAANEFVIVDASTAGRAATPGAPTGTGGAAGRGAYELTGPNEGQAKQYVGRRVEISGTLKAADVDASGRPTGGATAGKPPEGIDVTAKDLKLRELEVVSIRPASGTCPALRR